MHEFEIELDEALSQERARYQQLQAAITLQQSLFAQWQSLMSDANATCPMQASPSTGLDSPLSAPQTAARER